MSYKVPRVEYARAAMRFMKKNICSIVHSILINVGNVDKKTSQMVCRELKKKFEDLINNCAIDFKAGKKFRLCTDDAIVLLYNNWNIPGVNRDLVIKLAKYLDMKYLFFVMDYTSKQKCNFEYNGRRISKHVVNTLGIQDMYAKDYDRLPD